MIERLEELITLREVTAAPRLISGETDVTSMDKATVWIRMGRTVTNAHSAAIEFRIELSPDKTGNRWGVYKTPSDPAVGSSVGEEAVSGAAFAGQKVILMVSTTNFAVGEVVFIENTTFEDSEFGRIKVVTTDTSVTLEDNLENVQTGSTVRGQAEFSTPESFDVNAKRIRVVVDGSGTTKNFAIDAQVLLTRK